MTITHPEGLQYPALDDTAAPRSLGPVTTAPEQRRVFGPSVVLALILTCQLMVVLDATIVNIALPRIKVALDFSEVNLSWVINAYTLSFGGLLLLGSRAGDLFGRKKTFLGGLTLFALASLAGGFANDAGTLLAARVLQGVGAAFASPSALALLMGSFKEGRERTRAIGLYTAVSVGGAAVGLVAGGMLTQWASWRWVMFVNVPIGAVVVALGWFALPDTARLGGRFDIGGALTSVAGMTGLVYGFVRAASNGWSDPQTVVAFIVGAVGLGVFALIESRIEGPITPLGLFADKQRITAYVGRLLMTAAMMGMFFFLTQFMQNNLGYDAVISGVAFLPMPVTVFIFSQAASRVLLERFGARRLLLLGMTLGFAGTLGLTRLTVHSGYLSVIVPLVVFAAGSGLSFVPLTTMALSGVRAADAGAASGLVNVMQQVGGALGLAVLVTVFGSASRHASPLAGADAKLQALHAFTVGADRAFLTASAFMAAALILVVVVGRTRRPSVGRSSYSA